MGLHEMDAIVPLPREILGTETRVAESLARGSRNPRREEGEGPRRDKGSIGLE